jgi:guanylate kinase
MKRRGLMLVLSSPSGAGKTTLARELLRSDAGMSMSVSVTTRAPRPGEVDGRDYIFCDQARFEAMRNEGALLEWAKVHGNFYGTPKAQIMDRLADGSDVLFDIDWQGAQQLKSQLATDVVGVFILPPSSSALSERLHIRGQDSAEIVTARLAAAAAEIGHWHEYDYVLVNKDVTESLSTLKAILAAERLRTGRQHGLKDFVQDLQSAF